MEVFKLENMVRGWFVGNFEPSVLKTNALEVGVKSYQKGDSEERHFHKIATEITVVVYGKVKMNNRIFTKGDIIVLQPKQSSDFEALEDCQCVVVKLPGANNDKYMGECEC